MYFRIKLCALFGEKFEERAPVAQNPLSSVSSQVEMNDSGEPSPFSSRFPEVWNVPYARNPFFTGRDEILFHLFELLHREHTSALSQPLALSGLGGVGKTQIVLEYAYRYRQQYRFIFWTNAATQETLLVDVIRIASLLQLPERHEQDQASVLQAVKRWFALHDGWLWILDNVDDVATIQAVTPLEQPGHLLLTSRVHALGALAQCIEVHTMERTEGVLFLLRRAKVLTFEASLGTLAEELLATAEAIALEMDLLPLALDQAGAYIEETGCGLPAYLELFRTHRCELLHHRGPVPTNHPESVATTLSLSFQKVEQTNPAAADLLWVCAFLHPDAIAEELLLADPSSLGPLLGLTVADPYQFDLALAILRNASLVTRHCASRTLSIHRLVQAVLQDQLKSAEADLWSARIVRLVNAGFPEPTFDMWTQCEKLLAHVFACVSLVGDKGADLLELGTLVSKAGRYLMERGRYQEAKPLLTLAVTLAEQPLTRDCSPLIARLLHQGEVSWRLGEVDIAHEHWQRALALCEQHLEAVHPQIAEALTTVGLLYTEQGRYAPAEPLYRRALHIYEQLWGPEHEEHAETATVLNTLGLLYWEQGKYAQAEPLYRRALSIREQVLGSAHPLVGTPLNNLGLLYTEQGKYGQAEPLYRRALLLREQTWGPDHPSVAFSLVGLAVLSTERGQYEQAEAFAQRALRIREQTFGCEHRDVAVALVCLAHLYTKQGKYDLAEPLFQRAHRIQNRVLEPDHPRGAFALNGLATIAGVRGKYEHAEMLFQRSIRMEEQARGSHHVYVALGLHGLANIYRNQGKYQQAEPLYLRSLGIREQTLEPQHILIADTLHDFAVLKDMQGHDGEALPLYQRALVMRETILGREHRNL